MDFGSHLVNREDVVVIFIDMDPTISLTDCALPHPLDTTACAKGDGNNGPTNMTFGMRGGFVPPQTRSDVIQNALRSFVLQKQRATPKPSKLWFSFYAVTDKLINLMPLNRGDATNLDLEMKTLFESAAFLSSARTAPSGPFAFRSVANVLRQMEEMFAGRHDKKKKKETNCMYGAETASAASQSANLRDLTVIQGIVLLNRDAAMPIVKAPPVVATDKLASGGPSVCRFLDIIPLGNSCVSLPHVKSIANNRGVDAQLTGTWGSGGDVAIMAAESVDVDCPCNIIDLERFTGVQHRGLALGCALTRLLSPHAHRCEKDHSAQQLHRINLTEFLRGVAKPPPSPQQQQQERQLYREDVGKQRSGAMVVRTTTGNLSRPVPENTARIPAAVSLHSQSVPPFSYASFARSGSVGTLAGVGRGQKMGKQEGTPPDVSNSRVVNAVSVKAFSRATLRGPSQNFVRGTLVEDQPNKRKK